MEVSLCAPHEDAVIMLLRRPPARLPFKTPTRRSPFVPLVKSRRAASISHSAVNLHVFPSLLSALRAKPSAPFFSDVHPRAPKRETDLRGSVSPPASSPMTLRPSGKKGQGTRGGFMISARLSPPSERHLSGLVHTDPPSLAAVNHSHV